MTNRRDLLAWMAFSTNFNFSGIIVETIALSLVGTFRPLVLSLYVKNEVVSQLPIFEQTNRQVNS